MAVADALALSGAVPLSDLTYWTWTDGPAVLREEHKAYTEDLACYLEWLRTVEKAYPSAGPAEICQRMRRLHYCHYLAGAGPLFDKLFGTEHLPPPFVAGAAMPQRLLDCLYSTGNVMLGSPNKPVAKPSFAPFDVTHLWAPIERIYRGSFDSYQADMLTTVVTGLGGDAGDALQQGIVAWVGDLATVIYHCIEWKICFASTSTWTDDQRLTAATAVRASREDLLGDMDGQILAAQINATNSSMTLSTVLQQYYAPVSAPQTVANRFLLFVQNAVPAIPFVAKGSTVSLGSTAPATVAAHISQVLAMFVAYYRTRATGIFGKLTGINEAQKTVSANQAIVTSLAQKFCDFLSDGLAGRSLSWPTDVFDDLDRYGGHYLQLGDHDGTDGNSDATYGGTKNQQNGGYVATLQKDLAGLGVPITTPPGTPAGGSTGTFGLETQTALRHLQGYASLPGTAGTLAAGHPFHLRARRRYRGRAHGVVTPEVATTIVRWLPPPAGQPVEIARAAAVYTTKKGDPCKTVEKVIADQYRCPVQISAWTVDLGTNQPGAKVTNDVWTYDPIPAGQYLIATDVSSYYPLTQKVPAAGIDSVVAAKITYSAALGTTGPVTEVAGAFTTVWEPDTKVTPAALLGPVVLTNETQSTYRVVAAVAAAECGQHFDSMNGWDNDVVSLGLFHWTLMGELGAMLSYFKYLAPDEYRRLFGVYGLDVYQEWPHPGAPNPMWQAGTRNYRNALCLAGEPNISGAVDPDLYVTVSSGGGRKSELWARFADAHWWYRWLMACRTSRALWAAEWDFARLRLRDVLACPWQALGAGEPVAHEIGGNPRAATIGEVITSEVNTAILLRWHVKRPAEVVNGQQAGQALVQALTDARKAAKANEFADMDVSTWNDGEQGCLQAGLLASAPSDSDRIPLWSDSALQAPNNTLGTGHQSFKLLSVNLPDPQF